MSKNLPPGLSNQLLDALPDSDRSHILSQLTPVQHAINDVLYETRGPIDYVYFPTGAVMSALTIMRDGSAIEVATVGREGMIGHTVAVGAMISVNRVIVQIPDGSQRMESRAFQETVAASETLRKLITQYTAAFMAQVSQSVACNGLHKVEQRCCRWLLMTRDRVASDDVAITHEYLGFMLGVRRASVTEVLAPLQADGMLRSHRGVITILDRAALEARSCECYQFVRDEFERSMHN